MTSEEYVSNLLKVSDLKREIKNKFTQQNLQDQGLKQDLTLRYQPVTTSQTKAKDDIITHLSKLSNESQQKIDATLKNFPDIVNSLNQIRSLLDTKTEPEVVDEDAESYDETTSDSEKLDYLLLLADAKRTEDMKHYLTDKKISNFLLRYVEQSQDINFSTNPWRQIKIADPDLYKKLKSAKKTKKGTGVRFLPSGKQELIHELFRLIGSYKSGNKNVYNELNAVVDQLRRNGTLTIEQSKRIYKTIS